MNPKLKAVADALFADSKQHPDFTAGDNITVSYKITESHLER